MLSSVPRYTRWCSASCVDVLSLEAEGAVWAKTAVDADGNSGTVSVEVKALW